ncbi:MAG: NAD-dependent epimerase/dehydratase family protein, partial [Actinomycetes bacterium]
MKILVVGGTGFIGREIVSLLKSLNFEIMVMARDCSNQIPSSFIQGNLFEVESYEKNLRSWEPNIVIQAAWVTAKSEYRTSELNKAYS